MGIDLRSRVGEPMPRRVALSAALFVTISVAISAAFVGMYSGAVVTATRSAQPADAGEDLSHVLLDSAHAFLAAEGLPGFGSIESGLLAWDVADPRSLFEVGRITRFKPEPEEYDDPVYRDIAADGPWAVLASGSDGVEIIDVSVPSSPRFVTRLGLPLEDGRFGLYAERVRIDGDHAFVGWTCCNPAFPDMAPSGGVDVVALAASPRVVARWTPDAAAAVMGGVRGLDVESGRMYVLLAGCGGFAGSCGSSMHVVTVSSPTSPRGLGSVDLGDFSIERTGPNDLVFDDSHAFIADGDIKLVAVSDPSRPVESTRFSTPGEAYAIDFSGGYAYVADRDGGLFSQYMHGRMKPGAPDGPIESVGGEAIAAIDAIDVATTDTHAFVITADGRIIVYDITRHDPSWVSETEVDGAPDLRAIDVVATGGPALSCVSGDLTFGTIPPLPREGEPFTLRIRGTSGWSCAPTASDVSITSSGETVVLTVRPPLCDFACLPVLTDFTVDLEFDGWLEGEYLVEWREGCDPTPPLCQIAVVQILAEGSPEPPTPDPSPSPSPSPGPSPTRAPAPGKPKTIFVHGYGGGINGLGTSNHRCSDGLLRYPEDDTDFGDLAETFRERGYDTYLARWTTNFDETIRIEEAADCLAAQIDGLLAGSPGERVTLVAHSMGGIVSRYYIEALGRASRVERLITFGAPHAGIPNDFIAGWLATDLTKPWDPCYAHPGACQLGVTSLAKYNDMYAPHPDVDYEIVGGTKGSLFTSGMLPGKDDAVVQTASATSLAGANVRRWEVHDAHMLAFSPLARDHYKESAESINCLLKIIADGGLPADGCDPAVLALLHGTVMSPSTSAPVAPQPQRLPTLTGSLAAGERAVLDLEVDGFEATIGVVWRGDEVELTLITPAGVRIDPGTLATHAPGGEYEHAPGEGGGFSVYSLPIRDQGLWRAELQATGGPAEFELVARMLADVELTVEAQSPVEPGGTAIVRAWLDEVGDPVEDAELRAKFGSGDAVTSYVILRRVEPGGTEYRAEVAVPVGAEDGVTLHVVANGTTRRGVTLERAHTIVVPVVGPGLRLDGDPAIRVLERDDEGSIATLRLEVPVRSSLPGRGFAIVTIRGIDGRQLPIVRRVVELPSGTGRLIFDLPGRPIAEADLEGPYQIDLEILDKTGLRTVLYSNPLLTTPVWRASDFVGGRPRPSGRVFLPVAAQGLASP